MILKRVFIQTLIGYVLGDDIYIYIYIYIVCVCVYNALPLEIKLLGLDLLIDSSPFEHNQYLFELFLLVEVCLVSVNYVMVKVLLMAT